MWEPPPSRREAKGFFEGVLLKRLEFARVAMALAVRHQLSHGATLLELVDKLAECLDLELAKWGAARQEEYAVLEARLFDARRAQERHTEELESELKDLWTPLSREMERIRAERILFAHRKAEEDELAIENAYVARRARLYALQSDKRVLLTPHARDISLTLSGFTARGAELAPFRGAEAFRNIVCTCSIRARV